MPLWGKTDTANSAPKYLLDSTDYPAANTARDYGGLPSQVDVNNAFFVATEEARVTGNRAKGLQTPGWNLFETYTDTNGATRRRVEPLVVMKVAAATAGDAGVSGNTAIEDATVADS